MRDLLAAERYAQALFDIAKLVHRDTEILAELEAFSHAVRKSPEIQKFLSNPYYDNESKRKLLMKIYQDRFHEEFELVLNFFSVLLEKNRFGLIHEIVRRYKMIVDRDKGIGTALVRTAVPLDADTEKRIVDRLEKIAGYKIEVKKEVDPALLGGVLVKIRHQVLDGSVKSRIDVLKKELTKIRTV